ncbi:type II toxin-antitoxin system VapC family toxin [Olivibacter jilunii]|uniref:type II toxin-antitoxin system VapC family toxin n=1 Tax=Olivibacter jilunii TaxID=985016 RepID=UPI003F14EDFD
MNLLLDTNILLAVVRSKDYEGIVNFLNPNNGLIYVSVASEAEIKSIALRSGWGSQRKEKLDNFLDVIITVELNQLYINSYIEIDAYSQRSHPNFKHYPFRTPRNMGKNDLWIASLAALLGLKLITTDADFDHLDKIFFEVQKVKMEDFLPFL